jgi:hypothetical protein
MTVEQRKAIRQVVFLLVASITASVVFAVLTLAFRHNVLAYQQARDPSADPSALAATLWTRPIPILLVATFYAVVIRRFRAGSARAHRRIRIVSALGFTAVAWLLLSAAYPAWLRPFQALQLALLAALTVAVNRPVLRAAFPRVPDPRPRNRRAALTLAVLAPVIAEVSLGTVSLHQAWVMPLYIPIYGAGALLIRELVRRTGGGTAALLLLGVAYGLVEEGLALQSLTSPHLYGAAEWAPRLLGFNTAYTELNLAYHAIFSVTIPILLVELLFPTHGRAPYLRRAGVITTGVIALLGAALIRVSVPPTEDPGYTIPLTAALAILAATAALTVAALRPHPPKPQPPTSTPTAPSTPTGTPAAPSTPTGTPAAPSTPASTTPASTPADTAPAPLAPADTAPAPLAPADTAPAPLAPAGTTRTPPTPARTAPEPLAPAGTTFAPLAPSGTTFAPARPVLVAATTALAALGFLGLIWPFGSARQPMFTHDAWAFAPMTAAAAIALATGLLLRRWTTSPNWTPKHTLAACFGALTAHTCFGLAVNANTTPDRLFLLSIALITAATGYVLIRRPSSSLTPGACLNAATRV